MRHLQLSLAVCATLLACDDGADETANESTATSCAIESFDTSWWNQAFPEQTGMFHVEFSADVTAANMDAVIGLSNGPATKWASLAAIARFNPQGYVDARDGANYRADTAFQYQANARYFIRFDVDLRSHRYSVWIKSYDWQPYTPIARNYAFRTEQASVTRLNNVAAFVNPETSARGAAEICGFAAIKDDTTGNGCLASTAGGGFVNAVIAPSSTVAFVSFSAQAGQAGMDGVVGAALGDVDAYDDFAASIRFFTNGYIEARDGDQYRADRQIAYVVGQSYTFRMFLDISSHTYSVYVASVGLDPNSLYDEDYVLLASGYNFRPSQNRVTSIDRIGSIVASSAGRVDTCGVAGGPHPRKNVVAMRDGNFDVVPLTGGGALITNAQIAMYLRADNSVGWSVFGGRRLAADAANNVYSAVSGGGSIFVDSVTLTRSPRWSREHYINGAITDMIVSSAGELVIATTSTLCPYVRLSAATGEYISCHAFPSGTAALGMSPNQFVVARTTATGYLLESYAYNNPQVPIRSRQIDGNYSVAKIAVAPDGSFVIAGTLSGPTDFGTGELTYYGNSEVYWDWFVAGFASDISTKYARRLTNNVTGLFTNGRETAISYLTWTQLHYADYLVLDAAGNTLRGASEDSIVGSFGFPAGIALGESGRIYWSIGASFLGPHSNGFPFMFTIDP